MSRSHLPLRRLGALTLAVGLALGLGACGRSDSSSSSPAAGGAMSAPEAARDAAKPAATGSSGGPVSPDSITQGAMLARRADTALVVKSVREAVARIHGLTTTAGGSVLNESLSTADHTTGSSDFATITIQVPAAKLDSTLDELEKVGDMVSRNTSSDDVKAQVVDTDSRVKSLQAGIDRLRALMAQTTNVPDLINIESELSRRQADLEAMQAQLSSLKDQVAMSPVSIRLTTDRVELGTDGGGFLGGLKAGWAAFLVSVRLLLTAIGALIPFAVAAALVAAPFVWWARARRQRRAAAAQPAATTAPAAAATTAPQPATPQPAAPQPTPVSHPQGSHPQDPPTGS